MGTSLTGLTPSTTYDALIKVGDNGALSATAKVLSDGLGNDSILSLSTDKVGIGTSSPTVPFEVTQSVSGNLFAKLQNTNSAGFGLVLNGGAAASTYTMQFADYNGSGGGRIYPDGIFIGGQAAPTARLHVKGSGATSATTSLLVQNSAGNAALTILDDRKIGIAESNPDTALSISGTNAAISMRYLTGGTSYNMQIDGNNSLLWKRNSIQTGIFDYLGNFGFGVTAYFTSARVHVVGSGATSATTSLLVQNSAGTAALTILDDLSVTLASSGQLNVPNGGILSQGGVKANDNSWGVGWNNSSTWGMRGDSGKIGFGSGNNGAGALDTAISRNAAGVLEVNNGTMGTLAAINVASYKVNGTSGFTGTGIYTTLTIVGGIITNAT